MAPEHQQRVVEKSKQLMLRRSKTGFVEEEISLPLQLGKVFDGELLMQLLIRHRRAEALSKGTRCDFSTANTQVKEEGQYSDERMPKNNKSSSHTLQQGELSGYPHSKSFPRGSDLNHVARMEATLMITAKWDSSIFQQKRALCKEKMNHCFTKNVGRFPTRKGTFSTSDSSISSLIWCSLWSFLGLQSTSANL